MTGKKFFKTFQWGTVFSALFLIVFGILTASLYDAVVRGQAASYAFEYTAAAAALAAGVFSAAFYFAGFTNNAAFLLSGVSAVSVTVWLCVPDFFSRKVVPIAAGILLIFRALSSAAEAIGSRKEGKVMWIVRLVCAVLFLAAGVVSCVDPFAALRDGWIFSGVLLAAEAVFSLYFVWRGGFFHAEEELRFRPVKAEKEKKED